MNITKKILALMVASLMLFSAIPTFAAGESASEIAAAIDISMLTDEDARYITKDLDLDLSEEYPDAVINWRSSNPEILTIAGNKGRITAPKENTPVTLTAIVYAGGETATKDINLTVLIRNSVILFQEDFESPTLPADTSIANIDELKNKGLKIDADSTYFSSMITDDPVTAGNKVADLNLHTANTTGSSNYGGTLDLTAPEGTKRWIISMDVKIESSSGDAQYFNYIYGNNKLTSSDKAFQIATGTIAHFKALGVPANVFRYGSNSQWATIKYDIDVETMKYTYTAKLRDGETGSTEYIDFSTGNTLKFTNLKTLEFKNYRKIATRTYIDNIEVQAVGYDSLSEKENESGELVKDMLVTQNGDEIAVRSSYADGEDLVYVFDNVFENTTLYDNALAIKKAGIIPSAQGNTFDIPSANIFSSSQMGAPTFTVNGYKMGAGIGADVAVNVEKTNHGLSTRDLGLVFTDDSSTEWTLVSVPDENNLVFISENLGASDYKWTFATTVDGTLTGDYTITPESQSVCALYPSTVRKSLDVKVLSKDAIGNNVVNTLSNGRTLNGDSVEVKEEYSIINPVSVARELTANRPSEGYSTVPALDGLEELVKLTLTYTFDKSGRVTLKSNHKVLLDVPLGDNLNDIFDSFVYNAMDIGEKFGGATNKTVNSNNAINGTDTYAAVLIPALDGYNRYLDTNSVGFALLDGAALPQNRIPAFIPSSAFPSAAADTTINSIAAWEFKEDDGNAGKFVIDYADATYLFFDFSYASSFTHDVPSTDVRQLNTLSSVGSATVSDAAAGDTRTITVTGAAGDTLILKLGSPAKTDVDEAREFFEQYGTELGVDVEDADYTAAQNEILTSFVADMYTDNSWVQAPNDIRDALLSWQAVTSFRGLAVPDVDAKIIKYGANQRIGITNAQYSADVEKYNSTEIGKAFRECDSTKIAKPSDIKSIYDARILELGNQAEGEEEEDTTDDYVPPKNDVIIDIGGGSFGGGGSSDDKDDKEEEKEEEKPAAVSYKDLATTHWAYDYISKLNEKNIINGYEDGTVRPEESVTREQLVKMIVTALDLKKADTDVSFKDVPSGHWSEGYILNAASNGIISGYEDGGFKPQDKVTREDMAVIIKRALDKVGVSLKTDNEAVKFADSELIASYAKDSVDAVSAFGIISGMGDNSFNPKGLLTRAQAAKVIYLVCEAK